MKLLNEMNYKKTLDKFWEFEEIKEIKEEKRTVLEKFENDISFNEKESKYEVSLPFLEKFDLHESGFKENF